jgi:hypothetical protein
MGIRLVDSYRSSYSGGSLRWDVGLAGASVLFDGEHFAVYQPDCQPDGPHYSLDWAALEPDMFPTALAGWYGPQRVEELVEALSGELACDGYVAEPAA